MLSAHALLSLPSRSGAFLPVAFLGLLLAVATAFPASVLPRENLMNAVTPNKPTRASSEKTGQQISYLIKEVLEMRKEVGRLGDRDEGPCGHSFILLVLEVWTGLLN